MTIMRSRFDTDAPYIHHPRAAAIHYTPLPELPELDEIDALIASAVFRFELDRLLERRARLLAACADCPPVTVRNTGAQRRDHRPNSELKYRRYGAGPRNASGRAKS